MSSNIKLPPLRNKTNKEELDLVQLKQRFDKQLPKYGFMWRSMTLAQEKANSSNNNKPTSIDNKQQNHNGEDKENNIITPTNLQEPSLLDAILTKQPVQLGMHNNELCGENCYCAEPIIEIDNLDENNNEDASVYDVDVDEELADTDDEEGSNNSSIKSVDVGSSKEEDKKLENEEGDKSMEDESRSGEINIDDSLSSEESIILVSKTPKKNKMVIIDSDEESDDECLAVVRYKIALEPIDLTNGQGYESNEPMVGWISDRGRFADEPYLILKVI